MALSLQDFSSLSTRDQLSPAEETWTPNHWTTRELQKIIFKETQ